jgi:hypothetical protein
VAGWQQATPTISTQKRKTLITGLKHPRQGRQRRSLRSGEQLNLTDTSQISRHILVILDKNTWINLLWFLSRLVREYPL